ncbi:hypothetical protein Tco_0195928 [Tanacetum coccineum]
MAAVNNVPELVDKKGDDIMESVISCPIAKATWTDLGHNFEGPSDTKENRIMDLKLEYQTFKAKPTESLSQLIPAIRPCSMSLQMMVNANHTQTLDLADIYGRFVYKDNLIQRRYSDSKKALITTPSSNAISTAFFSNNVKVLMALADDELTVRKNHTRNGEWIDITMRKVRILQKSQENGQIRTNTNTGMDRVHMSTGMILNTEFLNWKLISDPLLSVFPKTSLLMLIVMMKLLKKSGYVLKDDEVQNPGGQNVGNHNGVIVVPGIANQNGNGDVVAARAEGNANGNNGNQIRSYNCRGLGYLARNYTVRPRRMDAAYLQTQLLIAQKEEAGIQLQAEEFDLMATAADLDEIKEVNANCILMANLQQASTLGTQTDKALRL